MANANAPRGLRWVRSLEGHKKPPIRSVEVAAATTIFMGGIVELDNTTGLGIKSGATTLTVSEKVIGVAAGYKPATTANEEIPVILARGQIFEIQAGNSATVFDTELEIRQAIYAATQYGFLAGATGATGLGISNMELDCAVTGTTAGRDIFTIHEWPKRPDNELGLDIKLHVRFVSLEILTTLDNVVV